MALPAFPTNLGTNCDPVTTSGSTYGYPTLTGGSGIVAATAFTGAVNTTGGAVTCNFATDTLIYLPEGQVWDDTQSCWVPQYMLQLGPTPRK